MKYWIIAVALGVMLLAQGCSDIEPRTGTRVTVTFGTKKPISREQLVSISKYLTTRGDLVLGVRNPRVDSVTGKSLVLLLPGKKVSKADIGKLIQPYSIELYHLGSVATDRSPNRPWKLKVPNTATGPFLFLGPNAERIDSHKDPRALLRDVVGAPNTKPVLTGRDILPNASVQQTHGGWTVLVRFTKTGAQQFFAFTKANRGEYLAVFYNGRLISAPLVKEPIPGGEAFITGFGKEDVARAAVSELNAGTLPMSVKITSVEYY